MTAAEIVGLFAAGVVGGIVSVLVSLVSLVTYPALLAVGLPPVAANVTNTVSLDVHGHRRGPCFRRELVGQRPTLLRLAVVAAAGGLTGAVLLLALPERVFEVLAPLLIAAASVVVMVQPRLQGRAIFQPRGLRPGPVAAFYLTAVYTGYFGAAGGVLGIAALGAVIARPLTHLIAAKNVLAWRLQRGGGPAVRARRACGLGLRRAARGRPVRRRTDRPRHRPAPASTRASRPHRRLRHHGRRSVGMADVPLAPGDNRRAGVTRHRRDRRCGRSPRRPCRHAHPPSSPRHERAGVDARRPRPVPGRQAPVVPVVPSVPLVGCVPFGA